MLAFAPRAEAQLTQVFTPGGLNGTLTTHTFENGPGGPGATYSFSSGNVNWAAACNYNQAACVTPSGSYGIGGAGSSTMTILFANAVGSLGLYFGNDDRCCSNAFNAVLQAYNATGLVGSVSVLANMNDGADQFLGFNSTSAVTYAQLYYEVQGANALALYVDDVSFADAAAVVATPEPASLSLLATGLLGMFGVARARRKRAA